MNIDWGFVLKTAGITGGVVITAAFILGYFRLNIKDRVKWHRRLGIAAFVIAILHASIYMYITYFK